jgi:hypothetical protein
MKSIKFPTKFSRDFDYAAFTEHSNKFSALLHRKLFRATVTSASGKKPFFDYIEEDILTLHFSILLKKHNPLNRVFNTKIDQLVQSGIVQHLVAGQFAHSKKVTDKQNEEEKHEIPEQLTMEHFEFCFYAVLIGLALSCFVFLLELLIGLSSSIF